MLKRSEVDLQKLEDLREQAIEGAFDTRTCHGLDDCSFIPRELIQSVKEAIKEFKETGNTESFKDIVKKLKW